MGIYQKLGLKRVINASGRVSVLGVSTPSNDVMAACKEGAESYVVIRDLMECADKEISSYTGGEMSCVTSCASAAVALSVAALITKGRRVDIARMPDSSGLKNEIIMQKGHVIDYGAPISTMVRLGGGVVIEAGQANEVTREDVEQLINENTAALFYVKSHHCVQKGMLSAEKMLDIAHRAQLPLLMDCAAEEDLKRYVALGADMVCYSGAKALEAVTSGFVTGKREFIQHVAPQYYGIGRAMKVGKEQITGLLAALKQYDEKDLDEHVAALNKIVERLVQQLDGISGLRAYQIPDEAGRSITRCRIAVDKTVNVATDIKAINEQLRAGDPIIWGRTEFLNQGFIDLDPRPLKPGEDRLIVERLSEIMEGSIHGN